MRLKYNSPVILTFALISVGVLLLDKISAGNVSMRFCTIYPTFHWSVIGDYIRMFSHIFGHANWAHLVGNFTLILLIGPILEEKYGWSMMLEMIIITAAATGIIQTVFFSTALRGASGIVFMLIILGSFTNIKAGEIPITFILIALLFLTSEIVNMFRPDSVSQMAHLLGAFCGSGFGFLAIDIKAKG